MGVSRSTLSRWASGERTPSAEHLAALAELREEARVSETESINALLDLAAGEELEELAEPELAVPAASPSLALEDAEEADDWEELSALAYVAPLDWRGAQASWRRRTALPRAPGEPLRLRLRVCGAGARAG